MVDVYLKEDNVSRIRVDAVASVESPTLIGSEYISIKPGKKNSELIPPNGEIKSIPKKSISDIIEELELEKTAVMVNKTVANILEITTKLKDPEGPLFTAIASINNSLSDVEKVISHIEEGKGAVGNLLKSKEVIETVLAKLEQVGKILENVKTATAKTPETINYVDNNLKQIQEIGIGVKDSIESVKVILKNIEEGSFDVPKVTVSTKKGIQEIRVGVRNIDKVVKSIQKNSLISKNIDPEEEGETVDSGLRE